MEEVGPRVQPGDNWSDLGPETLQRKGRNEEVVGYKNYDDTFYVVVCTN